MMAGLLCRYRLKRVMKLMIYTTYHPGQEPNAMISHNRRLASDLSWSGDRIIIYRWTRI